MELEAYLEDTTPRHDHLVDAFAYAFAAQIAKLHNDYLLLHIKPRPWWVPKFIFNWFIGKIVRLDIFKRNN
jgi:hypothetical protein